MKSNGNKTVIGVISVLTIIGLGFYFWKKRKDSSSKGIDDSSVNKLSTPNLTPINKEVVPTENKEVVKPTETTQASMYKCSCTGKMIDVNTDEETLKKFKESCVKNGGMVIEVKNKNNAL